MAPSGGDEAVPEPESEKEKEEEEQSPFPFPFAAMGGDEAAAEEKAEESKEPLLPVGTRIEGNYMGSGQWYKGVITAASHSGGYDLEYDDDEVENGVKAEWVREVKRLPFHIRMEQKAQREQAQAKEE